MLAYYAFRANKPQFRALWINLAVISLTLGLIEGYLWYGTQQNENQTQVRYEGTYTTDYFDKHDDILGYRPKKGVVVDAAKYYGDEKICQVNYSIDRNGLRVPNPDAAGRKSNQCILFFGCSFTFGEGVNDWETMPYRVGVHTKGKYRIYNFGFHGYGPHQMLSTPEQEKVDEVIDCQPRYVIYQALPVHVFRSNGSVGWGQHAPRYILGEDGTARRTGNFDDPSVMLRIESQFRKIADLQ